MTRKMFELLLAFLGGGGGNSAKEFAKIRQRLVTVLAIKTIEAGVRAAPEDLADEALSRVAHKLEQRLEIQARDPYRYFYGVAHLVLKEAQRKELREQRMPEDKDWPAPEPDPDLDDQEDAQTCLDECLHGLAQKDRELILGFYRKDKGSRRIAYRKALAKSLSLTTNALRIRAHRLRRRLESCVLDCLARTAK